MQFICWDHLKGIICLTYSLESVSLTTHAKSITHGCGLNLTDVTQFPWCNFPRPTQVWPGQFNRTTFILGCLHSKAPTARMAQASACLQLETSKGKGTDMIRIVLYSCSFKVCLFCGQVGFIFTSTVVHFFPTNECPLPHPKSQKHKRAIGKS